MTDTLDLITYDFEVTAYDWLVDFYENGKHVWFWNDSVGLKEYMDQHSKDVFIGFNSKHYDQFIMKTILADLGHECVKEVNDLIIGGQQGWDVLKTIEDTQECPIRWYWFNNADIMDDMQIGQSLKSLEGHLGMSVVESEISFDIDRPLTEAEKAEMLKYCQHDVEATYQIVSLRQNYLENKIAVGLEADLTPAKALSMTNAKLTAAITGAAFIPRDDERDYHYPKVIEENMNYIPEEVIRFFDKVQDPSIYDDDLWDSSLETTLGGLPVTYGWGGIHGALPNVDKSADDEHVIINADVASLYPNTIRIFGYASRNSSDSNIYTDILARRIEAKKAGNKALANALKLVLNTYYGAMNNQYNPLYDPLMARSVCITGQLMLTILCTALIECGAELIQVNTDGVMYRIHKDKKEESLECCEEWCSFSGYELEYDHIQRVIQKDVNNYIEVKKDGKFKIKGGDLVRGVSEIGAFKVNNDCKVVVKAIIDYFLKGIDPEVTIKSETDANSFFMISKAGSKYKSCYQVLESGKEIDLQKVNRIYATTDTYKGTLYKVHKETGQINKIEKLPEHCGIWNESIDNPNVSKILKYVDYQFYIDFAWNRINAFKGIKTPKPKKERKSKKMAAKTATTSIHARMANVKKKLMDEQLKKTGTNRKQGWSYFELSDMLPKVVEFCQEEGINTFTNFTSDTAKMTLVNTDNPEDTYEVSCPFAINNAIVAKSSGAAVQNATQLIGSAVTYFRRYLLQIAFDIIEQDKEEANSGEQTLTFKPATPQQRSEIQSTVTSANADPAELNALKSACAKLLALDESEKIQNVIKKIKTDTAEFTNANRDVVKGYLDQIKGAIDKRKAAEEVKTNG